MFSKTTSAISGVFNTIKTIGFIIGIITNVFAVVLPIAFIFFKVGNTVANIVVATVSLGYFIFYLVTYNDKTKETAKTKKTAKKTVKRTKKIVKDITKIFNLGVAIYGIVLATNAEKIDIFAIVITAVMAVSAIVDLFFMLISWLFGLIFRQQINAISEGIKGDFNNAVNTVGGFFKSIGKKKPKVLPPEGEEKPKFSLFGKKKQELPAPTDGEQDIEITVNEVRELPAPEEKKKRTPLAAIGSFVGGVRNKFTKKALPEPTETDENTDVAETPETV